MTEETKCSHCGTPLSIGSRGNLCPKCLLKQGLEPNTAGFTADGPEASARWAPPKPEELAARFPELEILELIGRGGMGAVYKARQKNLERLVALKILPPEIGRDPAFAERFAREAQAMARLSHPHIVAIHDFGERDGLFFFLMEYMDGLNLGQLMASGNVSPKEALAIVPQICDALQFAHDQGIVHRDIKPENILLDRRGQVKIADFGLAKLTGRPAAAATAEHVMGTPQYMAPEQTEHPSEVDHRSDIYSLGVVFYQMLTGELPLGKFEPPSHKVLIDVRLDEVVLRALEKEPDRRYQQASQVKTEVETILTTPPRGGAGVPAAAETRALPETPPRFSRTAIVGACWAALSLIFVIQMAMATFLSPSQIGSSPWWYVLGFLDQRLLALTAPIGTTVLGFVALSQIRRSAGKLRGLGLALFDALLFPLLALDGAFCMLITLARLFTNFYANPSVQGNPQIHPALVTRIANVFAQSDFAVPILILVTIAMALVVDFLIIRRAWRAANKPVGGPQPLSAAPPSAGAKRTWLAPVLLIVALVMVVPVLLVGITLWGTLWGIYEAIQRPAVTQEQQDSATKMANAMGPLDVTTDMPPRWVCRARVAEAEIADVEVGQEVRMVLDAFPGRKFQGKVAQVGKTPAKDPNLLVFYETVIDIADPDPRFKVGMSVNAWIIVAYREDVPKTSRAAKASSASESKPSFEEANAAALQIIRSRDRWPESPEALCKEFWAARARKDYEELKVLWPGSASFDWEYVCRQDANVTYVFGAWDGQVVTYATEEYYRQSGSYNMKMLLGSIETAKGKRYYVISGN
jgi:tRNA A-37 threonylcarbamoyl transferase component Bud32